MTYYSENFINSIISCGRQNMPGCSATFGDISQALEVHAPLDLLRTSHETRVSTYQTWERLTNWRYDKHKKVVIIAPRGQIDHLNAGNFESYLLAFVNLEGQCFERVVVDLAGVDRMTSAGLRVLAQVAENAKDRSLEVSVARLGDKMAEIFSIARFDHLMKVVDISKYPECTHKRDSWIGR